MRGKVPTNLPYLPETEDWLSRVGKSSVARGLSRKGLEVVQATFVDSASRLPTDHLVDRGELRIKVVNSTVRRLRDLCLQATALDGRLCWSESSSSSWTREGLHVCGRGLGAAHRPERALSVDFSVLSSGLETISTQLVIGNKVALTDPVQSPVRLTARSDMRDPETRAETIKIFISYAQEDHSWHSEFRDVLGTMTTVRILDDKSLRYGNEWAPALQGFVTSCDIALVLASARSLDSKSYVCTNEIPWLQQEHHKRHLPICWVALEDLPYEHSLIGRYHCLNMEKPLENVNESERRKFVTELCTRLVNQQHEAVTSPERS